MISYYLSTDCLLGNSIKWTSQVNMPLKALIDVSIYTIFNKIDNNFEKKISYIFATLCGRPALIFKTIYSVRSHNFSLKY